MLVNEVINFENAVKNGMGSKETIGKITWDSTE